MEHENFIRDRKEHQDIEHHGHDESRGHITLDFDVDAVLGVCDLIVVMQRPRKHYCGGANCSNPKNCESMTNESFLEINGMNTHEK